MMADALRIDQPSVATATADQEWRSTSNLGCRKHGISTREALDTHREVYGLPPEQRRMVFECMCCHSVSLEDDGSNGDCAKCLAGAEFRDHLDATMAAWDAVPRPADVFASSKVDFSSTPEPAGWLRNSLPILARGRSHAIFSPPGLGKSLLAQWLGTGLAGGFGGESRPVSVIYLDGEMVLDDWIERWQAMGVEPGSLDYFHLYQFPDVPAGNTAAGGEAMVDLARMHGAGEGREVVLVTDTFKRFVEGEENASDTSTAYHEHTGKFLKALGVTQVRLDHGTDKPYGSYGKTTDVDVEWKLTRKGDTFTLTKTKGRQVWIPRTVDLEMHTDPLRFVILSTTTATTQESWPEGTGELADVMDGLGIPLDHGRPRVQAALKAAGHGARNELITAAIRFRKQAAGTPETVPGTGAQRLAGDSSGDSPVSESGDSAGTGRDSTPAAIGDRGGALLKSAPVPAPQLAQRRAV